MVMVFELNRRLAFWVCALLCLWLVPVLPAADQNASASATALEEVGSVSGVTFTKVINYPLFKLGENSITLKSLLVLGILFILVIVLEKVVRERVVMRVFEKTELPEALEYGIARILGYIFTVIGFYMAFQFVGIDLSSLAFIAGAVGVGIGFGLQNIINNFVSGIIIFAEQPIAIGDRIEVGGVAGRVKKISLRSTTVVTNDNITMIVPNGDFISQTVTNWSHGDPKVRIRIPIGVAYGTDTALVERLLLEVAAENKKTLKDPEPTVFFTTFGESSLDFELAVWTSEMAQSPRRFISNINFAIDQKFREHDIEIPFPQRDLHVRSGGIEIKKAADSEESAAV